MKRKGFTLIELLIVIAIIGLLSTLAVTALGGARTKARDARRLADIKQIQTALEMYYSDRTDYPNPSALPGTAIILGVGGVGGYSTCLSYTNGFSGACAGTVYMGKVPTDPAWDNVNKRYRYFHIAGTNSYSITYWLETTVQGIPGNTWSTATEAGISQ